MIFGVDVSSFVTKVDWSTLAKAGIKFASVRCTVGLWADPKHDDFVQGARDAGIVTQSYCFDERKFKVEDEVDFFLARAKIDQLSPCGDFEELLNKKDVPPDAGARADAWAERVKRLTNNPSPVLYASESYWLEMMKQVVTLGGPLGWPWWMAWYTGSPNAPVVSGAPYVAHQFQGDVPMAGVVGLIDRDVVYAEALQALAAPGFAVSP